MQAIEKPIDILKVGTNALMQSRWDERAGCHVPECINWETFQAIGNAATSAEGLGRTIIVTSAAIARGMIATHTKVRPDQDTAMNELQRQSSVGWRHLQNDWSHATNGHEIGPIQLTRRELDPKPAGDDDSREIQRCEREEALRLIQTLLLHEEVPLINENDAVSHAEISFGDNDILAAMLAASMSRSPRFRGGARLFLLTNTNGVYEDKDDKSTRVPVIKDTDRYRQSAGDTDSPNGSGGMASKFMAADIANAAGVDMWVYDPRGGNHHSQAVRGEIGTFFPAKAGSRSQVAITR